MNQISQSFSLYSPQKFETENKMKPMRHFCSYYEDISLKMKTENKLNAL